MSAEKNKKTKAQKKIRRDKSLVKPDQEGQDFGQMDLASEFEQHVQVEQGSEKLSSSNPTGSSSKKSSSSNPTLQEEEEGEEEEEEREESESSVLQDEDYDPLLDQHGSDPSSDEESVKSTEPPFEYESVQSLRAMTSEAAWQYQKDLTAFQARAKKREVAENVARLRIDKKVKA